MLKWIAVSVLFWSFSFESGFAVRAIAKRLVAWSTASAKCRVVFHGFGRAIVELHHTVSLNNCWTVRNQLNGCCSWWFLRRFSICVSIRCQRTRRALFTCASISSEEAPSALIHGFDFGWNTLANPLQNFSEWIQIPGYQAMVTSPLVYSFFIIRCVISAIILIALGTLRCCPALPSWKVRVAKIHLV